ncbi:MAG TPA: hypothetical protein VGN52_13240 [Burkholderiales bacterium]|jgi:hypothetical protein
MRTALIILAGFILLAAAALIARQAAGERALVLACGVFIPLWLAAALVNLWFGVSRAGYGVAEEWPIALAIFLPPAVVAGYLCWKFS